MHLANALEDLEQGLNSRILVTGNLVQAVPKGWHSAGWHRRIRAESAAIVEFMLSHGIEPTQEKAAERVAKSLNKGGYAPQGESRMGYRNRADTVKRWHSLARSGHQRLSKSCNGKLDFLEFCARSPNRPACETKRALARLEQTCKSYRVVEE